ncbi:hypothetical protein [Asanoa hainanensis]|nr:hypothetical protein [Asanoa hainanensis]
MASLLLSLAPTKIARDHDVFEEPRPNDPAKTITRAAPNTGPLVEPTFRAINGFLRLTHISGSVTEHYVGHQPDFIAQELVKAKKAGQVLYSYWDKPGHADAQQITIAPALVRTVQVRHLEANLDSLYEDQSSYAL